MWTEWSANRVRNVDCLQVRESKCYISFKLDVQLAEVLHVKVDRRLS